MIYTPLTKLAMKVCYDAHKNQKDRGGTPYVFHPFHVAEKMTTETSTVVALLHDVIEDTEFTPTDLEMMGFPSHILASVELLSRDKDTSYMDYIARIKGDIIATTVKLEDLRHNCDLSRLNSVTEKDISRVAKYEKAIMFLQSK